MFVARQAPLNLILWSTVHEAIVFKEPWFTWAHLNFNAVPRLDVQAGMELWNPAFLKPGVVLHSSMLAGSRVTVRRLFCCCLSFEYPGCASIVSVRGVLGNCVVLQLPQPWLEQSLVGTCSTLFIADTWLFLGKQ